jgi:hypothetical protein
MMTPSINATVMNLSAIRKLPGALASLMMFLAGTWQNLRARIQKWVPMGYEDETGFHFSTENPSQD